MNALVCGLALMLFLQLPAKRLPAVTELSSYNSLDLMIIAAIESNFQQGVTSTVGAVGVMQLMDIAVREVYTVGCKDRELPVKPDVAENMEHNILIGYCFYSHLMNKYNHDIMEVLTHYNGGGRQVTRLRNLQPLPHETANYIVKFLTIRRKVPECSNELLSSYPYFP